VGAPGDRTWERDPDLEPQLVRRPGAVPQILKQVVTVGIVDPIPVDEVPLDPLGLVVAVVERVVDLADLGVDEEPDPLPPALPIPVENLGVDDRALPDGEGLVVGDRGEAGLDRRCDLDGVLGPVQFSLLL
jgi:hypothetical protein